MHTRFTGSRIGTAAKRPLSYTTIGSLALIVSLMLNAYCLLYHQSSSHRVLPTHEVDEQSNGHYDHCHGCASLTAECPECPALDATCGDRLTSMEHNLVSAMKTVNDLRTRVINGAECPAIPEPVPCHCAAPPSSSTGAVIPFGSNKLPYLIIGIGTVSRTDPTKDYLNPTLDTIVAQLPSDSSDPLFGQVQIWVMNHNYPTTTTHAIFELAKKRFATHDCQCVFFHVNPGLYPNPPAGAQQTNIPSPNLPGPTVQKQTRDVVSLARTALGKSQYYMFMEDDFVMCPNSMNMLLYFIRRAYQYNPRWISLKMSFGMNGFLLHNNQDLETFIDYLLKRQTARPPDHVLVEWSCAEKPEAKAYVGDRPHMTYRYHLFYHIGRTSSLRTEEQADYSKCFDPLNTNALFEVDAFMENICGHDDIMPCPAPNVKPPQIPYTISLQAILPPGLPAHLVARLPVTPPGGKTL